MNEQAWLPHTDPNFDPEVRAKEIERIAFLMEADSRRCRMMLNLPWVVSATELRKERESWRAHSKD